MPAPPRGSPQHSSGGHLGTVSRGRLAHWTIVEPARPRSTRSWTGTRCRRSATWLTMPDGPAALAQLVQHAHDLVEGVLVEAAEALVDEQRLQQGAARLGR